jgi:serine/threonine-protein kinase HipA
MNGLKQLSPSLKNLKDFPYTTEEQIRLAARMVEKLSIQGVQPKLSVRLSVRDQGFKIVSKGGQYIVKPQHPVYGEVPENEDLTMKLAASSGIDVPIHGLIYGKDGRFSFVIKRFDRSRKTKIPQEDFAQLAMKTRNTKYGSSMEEVGELLKKYCTFPALEAPKLFERVLFCFLVGNDDMHLKNFSVYTLDQVVRLTPAYDLLNSTILYQNPREELALPLKGKKRNITRSDLLRYFGCERLAIHSDRVEEMTERMCRTAEEQWLAIIQRSFLGVLSRAKYTQLLKDRLHRIARH